MSIVTDDEYLDLQGEQESSLDGLCDIEQLVDQGTDSNNNPLPPHWVMYIPSVPCAFVSPTGGQGETADKTRMVILNEYSVVVPKSTDVTTANRVTNIRDRFGVEVVPGNPPYDIKDVMPGTFAKILVIESIK